MLTAWVVAIPLVSSLCLFDVLPMPFEYSVLHADFNEIVPLGPWIVLLGMVLPPLVLFLRPLLPINSPMCFVDAASINQTDQVLMERGIYGEKVSLRENEDKAQACGKTRAQQLTLQRHRPEWTKKGLLRFRDRRRKLTAKVKGSTKASGGCTSLLRLSCPSSGFCPAIARSYFRS